MFVCSVVKPIAKIKHICTSCGENIEVGNQYTRWTSFDEGSAFTNKMHPECYEAHEENAQEWGEGEWEYVPFSYPRGSAE